MEELMTQLYGNEICGLATNIRAPLIVYKPDCVVQGLGDNCGDRLTLRLRIVKEKLEIEYNIDACSIVQASLNLMFKYVSRQPLETAFYYYSVANDHIQALYNRSCDSSTNNILSMFESLESYRIGCVELPWNLLGSALMMLLSKDSENEEIVENIKRSMIGCDACIVGNAVVNNAERIERKKGNLQWVSLLQEISQKDEQVQGNAEDLDLYRYCKIEINEKDKKDLPAVLKTASINDILHFFPKQKLLYSFIQNVMLLDIDLPKELDQYYRDRKSFITARDQLWMQMKRRLSEKNIQYSEIKGVATSKLYPPDWDRDYNDIDILVPNLNNFVAFTETLIYDFGFQLVDVLGVSGSLRELNDNMLSGHMHLFRLTDKNEYLIFDVSFPNIPLDGNRLLIENLEYNREKISDTDLIAVTATHCFKHTSLPINDINDCFVLLKNGEIDRDRLNSIAKKNNLYYKFESIYQALKKHYNAKSELSSIHFNKQISLFQRLFIKLLVVAGWPYRQSIHKLQLAYNKMKSGETTIRGNSETIIPVINQPVSFMEYIHSYNKHRVYFIATIIFHRPVLLEPSKYNIDYELTYYQEVENSMHFLYFESIPFLLTSFGIMAFSSQPSISDDWVVSLTEASRKLAQIVCLEKDGFAERFIYDEYKNKWFFI